MQKKDTPEAIKYLRQLLQVDPNDGYAGYNLASLLRSQGEYVEACELLVKTLERRPGDVQYFSGIGRLLHQPW